MLARASRALVARVPTTRAASTSSPLSAEALARITQRTGKFFEDVNECIDSVPPKRDQAVRWAARRGETAAALASGFADGQVAAAGARIDLATRARREAGHVRALAAAADGLDARPSALGAAVRVGAWAFGAAAALAPGPAARAIRAGVDAAVRDATVESLRDVIEAERRDEDERFEAGLDESAEPESAGEAAAKAALRAARDEPRRADGDPDVPDVMSVHLHGSVRVEEGAAAAVKAVAGLAISVATVL